MRKEYYRVEFSYNEENFKVDFDNYNYAYDFYTNVSKGKITNAELQKVNGLNKITKLPQGFETNLKINYDHGKTTCEHGELL